MTPDWYELSRIVLFAQVRQIVDAPDVDYCFNTYPWEIKFPRIYRYFRSTETEVLEDD